MEQFSLFEETAVKEDVKVKGSEETTCTTEVTKGKQASRNKASSKAKTTPKVVKKEEPKVTAEWQILYGLDEFEVNHFINPEDIPTEGISLEELRESMSHHFIRMRQKSHVHWDWDEKEKRLWLDIAGASKGAI